MRLSGVLIMIFCVGLAQSLLADGEPKTAKEAKASSGASPTAKTETKAPAALQRVAVLDMVATGKHQETAKMLTEVLSVEASRVKGLEVIGMGDIAALIGFEQQKQLVGCTDDACLAEIGGALGVRAILSSKIGKVGDTYVLSMRLVDTQAAKLLGSVYKTVPGKPDALIAAVQQATPELLRALTGETNAQQKDPAGLNGVANNGATEKNQKTPKTVSYNLGATSSSRPAWPAYVAIAAGGVALRGALVAAAGAGLSYYDAPADELPRVADVHIIGAGEQDMFLFFRALTATSVISGLAGAGLLAGGWFFWPAGEEATP